MNANAINNKTVNKAHCDWIVMQATELKALIAYGEKTIALNKTRALSAIEIATQSLNELKAYIESIKE